MRRRADALEKPALELFPLTLDAPGVLEALVLCVPHLCVCCCLDVVPHDVAVGQVDDLRGALVPHPVVPRRVHQLHVLLAVVFVDTPPLRLLLFPLLHYLPVSEELLEDFFQLVVESLLVRESCSPVLVVCLDVGLRREAALGLRLEVLVCRIPPAPVVFAPMARLLVLGKGHAHAQHPHHPCFFREIRLAVPRGVFLDTRLLTGLLLRFHLGLRCRPSSEAH
mmetsp:Transcript_24263/g.57831  ORF Transcript_24263/g.57831 Transcript_24263/m.57831 type:complete len:223 (+) Transcript_24263:970-1638(+)